MEYNDYMLKTKICAERMKTLREERGLTLREMAEEIGMSPCSVYCYEHSKHVPNIITLIKYAMYFGVSTDFCFLVPRTRSKADVRHIVEIVDKWVREHTANADKEVRE